MLTKKENFLETISGGSPDRFVNGFEFMTIVGNPIDAANRRPGYGELNVVNSWGITNSWPEGTPGAFPVHTEDKIVIQDIEEWRDYVKAPKVKYSDEEWAHYIKKAANVDRNETLLTVFVSPGLFEQCHHLCEMQNAMMNFYTNPDEMHELINFLADWEIGLAEELCSHLHPDALFHHDDWGSQISTFISPQMFEEFFIEPYKRIYGFYKEHGVKYIIHHSDSYAATLVPYMLEMGIDVWQGVMTTNNIPELIEKYGGKISFMGGIDSAKVDFPEWTPEIVKNEVRRICDENGKLYFIPCTTQGLPMSTFKGVYECVSDNIAEYSKEYFAK